MTDTYKTRRAQRKRDGICYRCPNAARPGRAMCAECAKKQYKRVEPRLVDSAPDGFKLWTEAEQDAAQREWRLANTAAR